MIAGRTDGYLELIEICYLPKVSSNQSPHNTALVKGHKRIRSLGNYALTWREMDLQCNTLQSVKAHQSSIGLLTMACKFIEIYDVTM